MRQEGHRTMSQCAAINVIITTMPSHAALNSKVTPYSFWLFQCLPLSQSHINLLLFLYPKYKLLNCLSLLSVKFLMSDNSNNNNRNLL